MHILRWSRRPGPDLAGVLLAGVLLVGHLAAPDGVGRYVAYVAAAALAAAGMRRGIARHAPPHPGGWRWLEAGLWLHTGYGLTRLAQVLAPSVGMLQVAESAVDSLAHVAMLVAAVRFLAVRRPGRDRDGVIDAACVLVAGGLLFWQVYEQNPRLASTWSVQVVAAAAVALLMATAVVVGVRLYAADRRPLSFLLLLAAAATAFTGNAVVVLTRPPGAPPRWVESLWLLGVLLGAAAARLPGMHLLGEPEAPRERRVSAYRVVGLGAALLVNPALVALWGARATPHARVLAATIALLTVLVLWRIGRLVTERERIRAELSAQIAQREALQAQLLHQATHDALTGLPNRALFLERATAALADPAARPAVVFLDLDGFKAVNDTLGHAAGDELLTVVAARLRSCLREGDLPARLGGDEFAMLLDTTADPDLPEAVARRILTTLDSPIPLTTGPARVGASIGIAHASPGPHRAQGGRDGVPGLLQRADAAMYAAKAHGRNQYRLSPPLPAQQPHGERHRQDSMTSL